MSGAGVIPYAQRVVFHARDAWAFRLARALVGRVSSHLDEGLEIRCHEHARAVAHHLGEQGFAVRVVDGKLGPIEHTWIVLGRLPGDWSILDVYAPGRLPQVQLIDSSGLISRGYEADEAGDPRNDVRLGVLARLIGLMSTSLGSSALASDLRLDAPDAPDVPDLAACRRFSGIAPIAISARGDGALPVPPGGRVVVRIRPSELGICGAYAAIRLVVGGGAYRVSGRGADEGDEVDVASLRFWIDELRVGDLLVVSDVAAREFSPGWLLSRTRLVFPEPASPRDDVVVTVTNLGTEPAAFLACLDVVGFPALPDLEVNIPVRSTAGSTGSTGSARQVEHTGQAGQAP